MDKNWSENNRVKKGQGQSWRPSNFSMWKKHRGIIISKDEGNLLALLRNLNFKDIIPTANNVEEAAAYIKKLYGTTDGTFTAYRFALSR
jgi:hypothetical protein